MRYHPRFNSIYQKRCYLLGFIDRSEVRPEQLEFLAIMKGSDFLSAHLHPHPQLLMADPKTAKVSVDICVWMKFLLVDNLAIHHKT